MTTPHLPFGSTDPSDLPQGVVAPTQLGTALQDTSASKYHDEASSRFPAQIGGTLAGSPANNTGTLGYVVNLFSQFASNVSEADPATITKPEDLHDKIGGFFDGLPVMTILEMIPIIGDIIEILTGVEDGDTGDLGTWVNNLKSLLSGGYQSGGAAFWAGLFNFMGGKWSNLDNLNVTVAEHTEAIADLGEVAAAQQATPAWVSNLTDMASAPRRDVMAWKASLSLDTFTVDAYHRHNQNSMAGGGTVYTDYAHTNASISPTGTVTVTPYMPKFTPADASGSSGGTIYYIPIVVDREGIPDKLRWITGADTSWFSVDGYYMDLCVYNPDTGNIEKVKNNGNLEASTRQTTPSEVYVSLGLDDTQQMTPGQILFAAHMQVAPGLAQTTRSFAFAPYTGVARAADNILQYACYRTSSYYSAIPSSIALSALVGDDTMIPWAAVSVRQPAASAA